ncbi:hypothetical protein LUZ60_003315 [Juncus effusus]|nr:hypothetical protein LUZ60_003315 [Juncus effusus]
MEKKPHGGGPSTSSELAERLPQALLVEILTRLDLYSLCSASPVCRTLQASVSQALSSISSLDLSAFPPTIQILNRILDGNNAIQCLILDCSRLIDSSLTEFAKEGLIDLTLLKCYSFSSSIFLTIGEKCHNLRNLALDIAPHSNKKDTTIPYNKAIIQMLHCCSKLESLALKFQVQNPNVTYFNSIWQAFPKTLKTLLLQPISNKQAKIPISQKSKNNIPNYTSLISLTLVLDIISDELILSLSSNLPNLTELNLEDNPSDQPNLDEDLTNNGFHFLSFCHNLTQLYLTRGKQTTFQRVNDVGIFLLSEGCKKLVSVRLGGFSKVTDAGYACIIHSCKNLRKIEIINAHFLSDLAFLDLVNSDSSIVEVRLISCNLLTSETAVSLASCRNLQVLDLSGCRSIADSGLISISTNLQNLIILDLGGSDITDTGLYSLACTNSPISSLTLKNCKRISDNGISQLFRGKTVLSSNVTTLDLGYIPRLTDRGIKVISENCTKLTNLSLRGCYSITNNSVARLGSVDRVMNCGIKMLDFCQCNGILADGLRYFEKPSFRGLKWVGIGGTRLVPRGNGRVLELVNERPGLMICKDGCEMGCKTEWAYHSS